MSVIFPAASFWNLFKTVIKYKFVAGNIPVIKRSLSFLGVGGREEGGEKRRREERWEHFVQFVGRCYERTVRHITFKRLKVGRRVC